MAAFLRGHGFENIQFEAVGYGQTQPVCRDDNDACHDRNRRVEFTITEPAAAQ
jgi:outer membrane protein OmpA-like peptidoglycan-associated protein